MARLQKDVVSYFPHDANACMGDTLTVLQSRFGNDGYAFWFKLLEKLASTDGHCLDVSDKTRWHLLLAKIGVDEITGVEIMKLLVEMKAIDSELWESRLIWCQNLVQNVADVYKNRKRELPQKPIITEKKAITTVEMPITTGLGTQSKVKESKGNNTNGVLPNWIDKTTWETFLEMRKTKRAVPTEKAKELLIKELEKLKTAGDDPNEVLNQSIMRNYTGVFPLKGGQGGKNRFNPAALTDRKRYTDPDS